MFWISRYVRIVVLNMLLALGLLAYGAMSYAQDAGAVALASGESALLSEHVDRMLGGREVDRRIEYIWMFAQGVEWRKGIRRPITIELVGADANFWKQLSSYCKPRKIGKRRVRVVNTKDFSEGKRSKGPFPNIVYVAKGSVERLEAVYAYFRGRPVLVISEQPYFGDGWMVSFPYTANAQANVNWVFSYNPQNIAELAKLQLKGKLKDEGQGVAPRRAKPSRSAKPRDTRPKQQASSPNVATSRRKGQTDDPRLLANSRKSKRSMSSNASADTYDIWRERMGMEGRLQGEDWGLAERMDWRNELLLEQAEVIARQHDTISLLSREVEVLLHELYAKRYAAGDAGTLLSLYPMGYLSHSGVSAAAVDRAPVLEDRGGRGAARRAAHVEKKIVSRGQDILHRQRGHANDGFTRAKIRRSSTSPWKYELEGQVVLLSLLLLSFLGIYFVSVRAPSLLRARASGRSQAHASAAGVSATLAGGGIAEVTIPGIAARRGEEEEEQEATSRLLANMSHEMRTPLNAIVGLSEYLSVASEAEMTPVDADAGEVSEVLRLIRSNAEALNRTVNNVMTLNMIQGGAIRLERSEFLVVAMLHRVKERMIRMAAEVDMDIPIVFALPEGMPSHICADEGKISAVLELSLSSALLSGTAESLLFGCEPAREGVGEELCFFVHQHGGGCEPADESARVDRTFSHETASQLVRLMGSELHQSRGGNGLRWEFSVPCEI
ncbi:MAG: hypothetical protein CSA97_00435 [Bacteroidetes bacterium]|nr:MAG: hypothetical protein CSA97_00435 [Bacteroidota bacterium]